MKHFPIFEKFSNNLRALLVAAERYAEAMQTGLGSEHLLVAMIIIPNSRSHQILKKIPLTIDQLQLVMRLKPSSTPKGRISQELKLVLEKAAWLAAEFRNTAIEIEHLLLAIARTPESQAHILLKQAGIEPSILAKTLESNLAQNTQSQPNQILKNEIELLGVIGPEPRALPPPDFMMPEFDEEEESIVEEFTVDFTHLARQKKLDPLIGREKELERMIHILGRKTKNNPVLIGEPGVGKTALVEGLAQRIIQQKVPAYLANAKILSLELSSLVAGTMYRGQFEARIRKLLKELSAAKQSILFIDELHTIVGAGSAEGSLDVANILKPILAKGNLKLIGATTIDEYKKYISRDSALERRLQSVQIHEPTARQAYTILLGIKKRYENFHRVKIDDQILKEIIRLSDQFILDRFLPDKAIDLMDEAASYAKASMSDSVKSANKKITLLKTKLHRVRQYKKSALEKGDIKKASVWRTQELKLKKMIASFQKQKSLQKPFAKLEIHHLEKVISDWTGIPVERLSQHDRKSLLRLKRELESAIIGQSDNLQVIVETIWRAKNGFKPPHQPLGSFLLVGPTGVGKTETARLVAQKAFGSSQAMIRFDMSEFKEPHQVARLIGAPPGYIGHEDVGMLEKFLLMHPQSVILFDEIEKAHPDFFNLLLQILEEGILTTSKGKQLKFNQSLIILTSNIGSEIWQNNDLGFRKGIFNQQKLEKILEESFRPELLARLTKVLFFKPLKNRDLAQILDQEIKKLTQNIKLRGYQLHFTQSVKNELLAKIKETKMGARWIKKIVQEELITMIAKKMLQSPRKKKFKFSIKKNKIALVE